MPRNRVVVITGGGSGIGAAIAAAFAQQGTTLCLVGRRLEKLQEIVSRVQQDGGEAFFHQTDLAQENEIVDLSDRLLKDFDSIDVLVHSAGAIKLAETEKASLEDFDAQYQINVRAPYVLTRALLPTLRTSRGQVVFINSSAGLMAKPGSSQYAATKHALKAVADSLRGEVNKDGIRILSVYLGRTATALQEAVNRMEGNEYRPERYIQPEDVASVVLNALMLPRTAEVTDVHIRPMLKTY